MTYIIAGKLNNETFLMSDCIVTNSQTKKQTFIEKTIKLDSSLDVYYSFTGVQFIDNCVKAYDYWLVLNGKPNDFTTGLNSIKELIQVINKMIESYPDKKNLRLGENRLFFIDSGNVVYYDLTFNNNCKLVKDEKNTLDDGFLIDSVINYPPEEIILNSNSIEVFCKEHLNKISKKINFKNRFSFVHLNNGNKAIFKRPFKYFSDIVAIYNEIDYNEIDNNGFKWTI